jgi:hypothetical protein
MAAFFSSPGPAGRALSGAQNKKRQAKWPALVSEGYLKDSEQGRAK